MRRSGLGDKTSIHHGSKAATVADLSSLSGQPAKVHYTDFEWREDAASSVMVGGAHHTAAEHKAASSSATPK